MERQRSILIPLSTKDRKGFEAKVNNATKIKQVGMLPVFVSEQMDEKTQDKLYNMASGVLIPGGQDIDPSSYGERSHPAVKNTDKEYDAMQLRIIKKTFEDKKPLLGICRGAQLLAVASGGKLIQHLPDETEEKHGVSIDQYDDVYPSSIYHDVLIEEDTKAFNALKTTRLYVPSRHHQAIKDPGELIVSGKSPKGITEIVEHPSLPFHLGIQTHPELVDTLDSLFEAFADASRH